MVSVAQLYRFASRGDRVLLFFGVLSSLAAGGTIDLLTCPTSLTLRRFDACDDCHSWTSKRIIFIQRCEVVLAVDYQRVRQQPARWHERDRRRAVLVRWFSFFLLLTHLCPGPTI